MNNIEIANLAYQDILVALQKISEEYPTISLHVPSYIKIDEEIFYLEDIMKVGIKKGFEFVGEMKVMHNDELRNAAELLNENQTSDKSIQ
jgi:hypothetical protein